MGRLKMLGQGQGYLKAGCLGFNKSGKTYTSALLAVGVREMFGLTGPIAMVDSEGGSEYIAPLVKQLTGDDMVGDRTMAFDDLLAIGKEAVEVGVSVLLVDSMTHFWRELCEKQQSGISRLGASQADLGEVDRVLHQLAHPYHHRGSRWVRLRLGEK